MLKSESEAITGVYVLRFEIFQFPWPGKANFQFGSVRIRSRLGRAVPDGGGSGEEGVSYVYPGQVGSGELKARSGAVDLVPEREETWIEDTLVQMGRGYSS